MSSLDLIRGRCLACRACSIGGVDMGDNHLSNVFSTMNPQATIMVVGQNPGREEVRREEPFVGASGLFWDDAIDKVLGLSREDFYISNALKCFTPGNRAPMVAELDRCRAFLDEEVKLVGPVLMVALGACAFKQLTGMSGIMKHYGAPIFSIRYKVDVIPVLHPSPFNTNNPDRRQMLYDGLESVGRYLADLKASGGKDG